MQESITRSTQRFSKLRRKKGNDKLSNPSVFELINEIPTSINYFNLEGTFSDNLSFAKNIVTYNKLNNSKDFEKLSFDVDQDDVSTFIGKVLDINFKKEDKIGFNPEAPSDTYFLFEIPFDPMFYVLEAKFFETMPSEPLKIAYAHLISRFESIVEIATLNHLSDDQFTGHFLESSLQYFMEEEEAGSVEHQINIEQASFWAKTYHKAAQKISKYAQKDISIINKYIPKKESTKKLKELLLEGLNLNIDVLYSFANSDADDFGYMGYMNCFAVLYDTDSFIEQNFMESHIDYANNAGISMPSGYHKYTNGVNVHSTTDQDSQDFLDICQFIEKLTNYLKD